MMQHVHSDTQAPDNSLPINVMLKAKAGMGAYFHTMIRSVLFAISIFFFSEVMCQQVSVNVHYMNRQAPSESDTIYYNPLRKLTWADFRGKPDPNHFGGAITASGFAYNADMAFDRDDIRIDIYVYTFFIKSDSWRKPDINGPYHLEHEQKHFDITYLGAMNFVSELKRATFTRQNFKNLPGQIFQKVYDENTALQRRYDRETQHSINQDAQLAWNEKIGKMMRSATGAGEE